MNTEWQSFLAAQGATTDAEGVIFPATASTEGSVFDLSHLGLIAIQGADADHFLQGQLSNDMRELTERHSHLSSHCNPKGRMLANFRLFRHAGLIYLQLPREHLPPLLKRLGMFKLRSQVDLHDASDELMRIGLAGPKAPEMLTAATETAPQNNNDVLHHGGLSCIRLPGPNPRFEILGLAESLSQVWINLMAQGAMPANRDQWALLDIRAGIPTIFGATAEAFVPQMTNMQLIDGVSFTKGCYTGQEVVARMQYLGKLKRRMYLARVESPVPPRAGDELYAAGSESGQGAGRIVDARTSGNGDYDLLAVLEITAAEAGDVRLGEDGPVLEFLDLPYPFPEPQEVHA